MDCSRDAGIARALLAERPTLHHMSAVEPRRNPESTPLAVPDTETALFDGEAVVFHAPTRTVHRLGSVAGAVWLLCDGDTSVHQIAAELAEVFGTDLDVIEPNVHEALEHLAAEGLLVGSEAPQRIALARHHARAADGTPILTPPETSADHQIAERAGAFAIRLRPDDPVVVIVQCTEKSTLDIGRRLFARWIDDSVDSADHRASFVITAGEETATDTSARAPRALPTVRFGASVMARSRTPDTAWHGLARILGGIHQPVRTPGVAQVGLRPFATDDAVVLVHATRPTLANDPSLSADGIEELPVWVVGVDASGTVILPPHLPDLRWDEADVTQPATITGPFRLKGFVVFGQEAPAEIVAELAANSGTVDWFHMVDRFAQAGDIRMVSTNADARAHVRALLGR